MSEKVPVREDPDSTSTEEEGEILSPLGTTIPKSTTTQETQGSNEGENQLTQESQDDEEEDEDDEEEEDEEEEGEVKEFPTSPAQEGVETKDEDQVDNLSQPDADAEEGKEEDETEDQADEKPSVEDQEKGEVEEDVGEDESSKPTYSTRNRSTGHEENALDRLAAIGDMLSQQQQQQQQQPQTSISQTQQPPKELLVLEPTTRVMRESFLSDSLTEEERRTRTRYIPQVEGMHALRKHEVKSDLALARNKSKNTKNRNTSDDTAMDDMDDGNNTTSSGANMVTSGNNDNDETMSDIVSRGQQQSSIVTFEIANTLLNIPSPVFVVPGPEMKRPSPREVEAVNAFNPPRPPESIGAKKKHRMLRWERRPTDIEMDLNNYRKTVQRTRDELQHAEEERDRIKTIDNVMRKHFVQHLKCLNEEMVQVSNEISKVQQECMDLADLPSTRTRTRGSFKASAVMRDILHTVRAKGKEIQVKGLTIPASTDQPKKVYGMGGVSAVSFKDWNVSSSVITPGNVAEAWILKGDQVQTPYGKGIVVDVFGPSIVDPTKPSDLAFVKQQQQKDENAMDIDTDDKKKPKRKSGLALDNLESVMPPRVAVMLPFGVAFFNLDSVSSAEDPSRYSDDMLAKRWKGLYESAMEVAGTVDVAAMAARSSYDDTNPDEDAMDVDSSAARNNEKRTRLVPFGAAMLPTCVGRGALLHTAKLDDIEQEIRKSLFSGGGILGKRNNPDVTQHVRETEDQREEYILLQAKALHLRNKVMRQRRSRLLNERTYAATQERANRVESLVAELRTDLKSLKRRLDMEIRELGITEEQSERILTSFYTSLDSQHRGESSPPKRPRRFSHTDEGNDNVDDSGVANNNNMDTDNADDGGLSSSAVAV